MRPTPHRARLPMRPPVAPPARPSSSPRRAGPTPRVEIVDPGRARTELGHRRNLALEFGRGDQAFDALDGSRRESHCRQLFVRAALVDHPEEQSIELLSLIHISEPTRLGM